MNGPDDIDARRLQGRDEPENHGGQERDAEAKEQHRDIEPDDDFLGDAAVGNIADERLHAEIGEPAPDRGPEHGQDQALQQQLPDQPAARGAKQLLALWTKDKYMSRLEAAGVQHLEKYFDFALVPPDRDIIRQDEYGNFMVVLLTGSIAVDRLQPWGEQMRLTEARPGDILGEMSLLDSGMRFSVCTSLAECEIAVLGAEGMDQMMQEEPQLAAALVALLARKLSMRLRVVGARLSERQQ